MLLQELVERLWASRVICADQYQTRFQLLSSLGSLFASTGFLNFGFLCRLICNRSGSVFGTNHSI